MRDYFYNAATTPISEEVLDEMMPFLRNNYGNPSSTHQEGRTAKAGIEKARKIVKSSLTELVSSYLLSIPYKLL